VMCEVIFRLLGRVKKLPPETYHVTIKNVYMEGEKLNVEALIDKVIKETKNAKNKKTKRQ
jgi:hypothetical protein